MLVVVLLAFGSAFVADPCAQLQHLAQHLLVRSGSPRSQLARRLANIRAVEANPDALPHIHFLGRAGVRAAEAHPGAVHQVMSGIAQRLVLSERTIELHVTQLLSKLDLPRDVTANRRVLAVLTQLRAAT